MSKQYATIDGNEAAARIAYRLSEVIAIYPITPSSPMGEFADEWAAQDQPNIWGTRPLVQEMQSEGGAAGAIHGALQTGSLTTTFTASQGLLLMIPNMYKIAGELTPAVFHVAARSLAAQALSIFGDHSDVMAARATGMAMLASGSLQEVTDMALIAHIATLETRIPFIHFFDGFRTSHEINKIETISDDVIREMVNDDLVLAHRGRGLTPDRPVLRGTAQNPDVYFQARETVNKYYQTAPQIVQDTMDRFAQLTGRQYKLFDYHGPADAERVMIIMGSGAEAAHETVDYLNAAGEKVGLVKVRLFRPFSMSALLESLPKTTRAIAVLDRTKEPGAAGEPLYLDVINTLYENPDALAQRPTVIGGRYGLSSKEFTPPMIKSVFEELDKPAPKNHFTIGIVDDVTHTSLEYDAKLSIEGDSGVRAIFYGLGSDGTVSANKSSIKIIGENTDNFAQGYFVYDSKKSGSMTISHLRFGPDPIRSTYLVSRASFVGCHQYNFLDKYDVLEMIDTGGVFLLNSPYGKDDVWDHLPGPVQKTIIERKLKFYTIDAYRVAREKGMGMRINTIMQTCFFAISGILPKEEAIAAIKGQIQKVYGKKGEEIVQKNFEAVDHTLANLFEVAVPKTVTSTRELLPAVAPQAPEFVREVTAKMMARQGDLLPVSCLPDDGTYPTGTAKWERRNIAQEIPVWDPDICIQCGKCVSVCPHAVIRTKIYEPGALKGVPETFKSTACRDRDLKDQLFTIQVAPEDCTGCAICVEVCPVKNKSETKRKAINMEAQPPIREMEVANWDYFQKLPDIDRSKVKHNSVRGIQSLEPLFEFSGACAGCGETPYIKIMSQLFGDRALVANATGCSSIYGGNLPTTPWTKNADGRGPAWSNSLFEDNAEFGLGFRLSVNKQREFAAELLKEFEGALGTDLVEGILKAPQTEEAEIFEQRERVAAVKDKLRGDTSARAKQLLSIVDMLVKKSIWIIGGDGWAYDIGFGGLDHVMASGEDLNILVLDTEVYSNTGGQMSKSTPRAAVAKFAAAGKPMPKKDLARIAMTYEYVYVANVALGAKDEHTVKAFLEAERYPGPSLIIAYSHCIAHGINMSTGMQNQKDAVMSGHWPLFRFNPQLRAEGKNPLIMDSGDPKISFRDYAYKENRYKMLLKSKPEISRELIREAQADVNRRLKAYQEIAAAGKPGQHEE